MSTERESRPTGNQAAQSSTKNYGDDTAVDTAPTGKRVRHTNAP